MEEPHRAREAFTSEGGGVSAQKAGASAARPGPASEPRVTWKALGRVAIESVEPEVDCGRFAIKRVVGESVRVRADIHADGHDVLAAALLYKSEPESEWRELPMRPLENDRWESEFRIEKLQPYLYTIRGWVDRFRSWGRDFVKRAAAGVVSRVDVLAGCELIEAAGKRARQQGKPEDAERLREIAARLRVLEGDPGRAAELAQDARVCELMDHYAERTGATSYAKMLRVTVERPKAQFSTWYEMFPRSCTSDARRHGTFRDCIARLDYVAEMGFDVLYFPPIHPIGRTGRKGKNNNPVVEPGDPGTPWAIGSAEGGFTAIHPQLGTLDDFQALQRAAQAKGIEIAMDLAFQSSPDHPYVKEHPGWFKRRADGSIPFAENPPKKYEDIYLFDFEGGQARELCEELKRVALHWAGQGVRIFRVHNPHTKPYDFWEWLIAEVRREYPDVIFLAEAFTRPKVMYRLAKAGFSESYTYFAWRNWKREIEEYFTELTHTPVREFFRRNLWPNTPDILTEPLQRWGRPAFIARLVLAATLGANYGIYGPAFELCENRPVEAGSEEYLHSEKYEIRAWDISRPESLRGIIARVNTIRKQNRALQSDGSLRFHAVDNDQLIAYSKVDGSSRILAVVNLNFQWKQSGWIELPLERFGLDAARPYEVQDLLTDARYRWQGIRNYVELDPAKLPAHVFRISAG